MNVGLILRNYDHLVKRLAFPTTSFLDEGTLGEQGDNEERGRNRILIERIDTVRVFLVRCFDSCEPYQVSILPLKPSRWNQRR